MRNPLDLRPEQREGVALDGRAMGLSIRQIADYLWVSPATVRRDLRRAAERGEALRSVGSDAYRSKPNGPPDTAW